MKTLKYIAAALIGAVLTSTVAAQPYPNKPVRIIVAYQAGQGTDVATRYIAEQLSKSLGQNFFVDNRPGAGANLGTMAAARAPADGYTLTMGTNATHGVNQFLYSNIGFDPEKDFEPIILTGTFPMVISASPTAPINSISELVASVKENQSQPTSRLPSTTARLVFEFLKSRSNAPLFGVPTRGRAAR